VIPSSVILACLPPESRHAYYATEALAKLIDKGTAYITVYRVVVTPNDAVPTVCAQLNFEDGTARELFGVGPNTKSAFLGLLNHPDLHANG
jgi:hypothetical protein